MQKKSRYQQKKSFLETAGATQKKKKKKKKKNIDLLENSTAVEGCYSIYVKERRASVKDKRVNFKLS